MKIIRILLLVTTCLLAGCQVEYHPYDTRVDGETGVNAKNMTRIEASCAGKQEIRFAMISDTLHWYDETEDAVKALNRRDDIDFVIHTGDMADFGMRDEFERQRDILNRLRVPYVYPETMTVWPPANGFSTRYSAKWILHLPPAMCVSSA